MSKKVKEQKNTEVIDVSEVIIDNGKIDKAALAKQIAENSAVLEVHISQPWFRHKINSDKFLDASGNGGNVDPSVIHVVQDVINQKRVKDIMSQRIRFTNALKMLSVPGGILSLGNGQYLIPLKNIEKAIDLINKFEAERNALIDQFEEKYEEIKDEAREQRGVFYDESDYPEFSKIRAKYDLSYRFLSNSVPTELSKVNQKIFEQERARVQAECEKAVDEIRSALRESFAELVEHLADRLQPDEKTGKAKIFHGQRVEKLKDFIDAFANRNLTGDAELEKLTEKARLILDGVSIDEIRKNEDLRGVLGENFETIKQEAAKLVVTKTRSVKLD